MARGKRKTSRRTKPRGGLQKKRKAPTIPEAPPELSMEVLTGGQTSGNVLAGATWLESAATYGAHQPAETSESEEPAPPAAATPQPPIPEAAPDPSTAPPAQAPESPPVGLMVTLRQGIEHHGIPAVMRALLVLLDYKRHAAPDGLKEAIGQAADTLRPAVEKAWKEWAEWLDGV